MIFNDFKPRLTKKDKKKKVNLEKQMEEKICCNDKNIEEINDYILDKLEELYNKGYGHLLIEAGVTEDDKGYVNMRYSKKSREKNNISNEEDS